MKYLKLILIGLIIAIGLFLFIIAVISANEKKFGAFNFSVSGVTGSGTSTFSGNLIPSASLTYDIGTSSLVWRNLYASTGTFSGVISAAGTATSSFAGPIQSNFAGTGIAVDGGVKVVGTVTSTYFDMSGDFYTQAPARVLGNWVPKTDAAYSLGTSLLRWDGNFSTTTISTSTITRLSIGPSAGIPETSKVLKLGVNDSTITTMVSLLNEASAGEAAIDFRKSTNDGSGFSLSYTGPTNATVTSTGVLSLGAANQFVALAGGSPSWGVYSNAKFDVYGGLRIQPIDFAFLGTGGATNAAITAHNSNTASLNFGVILAAACSELTMTVTGATTNSTVALGGANLTTLMGTAGISTYSAWASAADTVTVRVCNTTALSSSDPAAATIRADIWNH